MGRNRMSTGLRVFFVCVFFLASFAQPHFLMKAGAWCQGATGRLFDFAYVVYNNHGDRLCILFLCSLGAFLGPLFHPRGIAPKTAAPFLKNMFPNWSDLTIYRLDIGLTICIGAILAYLIMRPSSNIAALASGTGWSLSLKSLGRLVPAPQSDGNSNGEDRTTINSDRSDTDSDDS